MLCQKTALKIAASFPSCCVAEAETTIDCASIIFPMTPPHEFAAAIRIGLSPVLMAAANSCGGVMGKMIDAQSIVVAATATNQAGKEAAIFRAVFWHSLALAVLVALVVTLYAFALPGVVPAGSAGP